jgi:peptidyl-prolyl cis-trans isomerase D
MLQQLRDQTQSTGFKILVIAIILVLTLFGFGATNVFLGTDPKVAQVGDFDITENVLNIETEREKRRILSQVGPEFDPDDIDRLLLQQSALNQLINRQVLYQTTAGLGIKVSTQEVNEEILASPVYQVDGKFNEAVYRQQVQALGYQPVEFLDAYAGALSSEQLRGGVRDSTLVLDWEIAEAVKLLEQRRSFAYLALNIADYSAKAKVSFEEIQSRYARDQEDYTTPLTLDVEYIQLSVAELAATLDTEVDDSELRQIYEIDRAAATSDDEREASHILVETNETVSETAALRRVNEIAQRINDGEDFAQIAKEVSEDIGSAEQGGFLGRLSRDVFEGSFSDALWSLDMVGQVSPPVRTEFGYHVIKLNNIFVADYPSFDEELPLLKERVKTELAQEKYSDRLDQLERSAYDERYALKETASFLGLTLRQEAGISEDSIVSRDQDDTLLTNADVLEALFSEEVLAGENSQMIQVSDNQAIILRVAAQYQPQEISLEEVAGSIESQLRAEKGLAAMTEAKFDALTALETGTGVSEVATFLGQRWITLESIARIDSPENVPAEVLQEAFRLPRPDAGEKSIGSTDYELGGALVIVTQVVPGDVNATMDVQVEQFRDAVYARVERSEFVAFFQAAENSLGVVRAE